MLIAGETSGDILAAELVSAVRREIAAREFAPTSDLQPLYTSLAPRFFGAGGPRMAAAGVQLAVDMTEHSVVGLVELVKHLLKFRRLFYQLLRLARDRQPDAIICVDFSGFNRRFAHAVRKCAPRRIGWFQDWNPRIIQLVSPQVWASRPGRARSMEKDLDLLLSIFPFEPAWYARRTPSLRVEFVGHPIIDRYASVNRQAPRGGDHRTLLLLPGSRGGELERHLPVLIAATDKIVRVVPRLRVRMVLPGENLLKQAQELGLPASIQAQVGGLAEALQTADAAIASTGTVTMECAYFGVPTVALYKTSWSTYHIGKRIVQVRFLAMPNLLANEELFPEFVQDAATAENISKAAIALLTEEPLRARVKARLAKLAANLGEPGASQRAARAVLQLLETDQRAGMNRSSPRR